MSIFNDAMDINSYPDKISSAEHMNDMIEYSLNKAKTQGDDAIVYVDVNLSVVQCMQEKLHERLVSIMDEYNLEYKYINLEITETAAIMSSETLERNMKILF